MPEERAPVPQPFPRLRRALYISSGVAALLLVFFVLTAAMGVLPWQDPIRAARPAMDAYRPNVLIGLPTTSDQLGISPNVMSPLYLEPNSTKWQRPADADDKAGQFNTLLNKALLQPENLDHWQLCGDELRSEQTVRQALGDNPKNYPHDAPNNRDPNSKLDADVAAAHLQEAAVYMQAANAADDAQVACTNTAVSPVHWLVFDVQVYGQWQRLAYPDVLVLRFSMTAEAIIKGNLCVDSTRAIRERTAKKPVDAAPRPDGLDTFSERQKAFKLAQLDAQVALEEKLGRQHC